MILYDSPISGNCYKVRLLAAHLGLPLERHALDVVDRSDRPDLIGHLNPALRVPTLVLDDGRPLAESGAILWYLAEGTRFLPEDPYDVAQALQWMFFEQYDHEPNIAVARFWLNYAPNPENVRRRPPGAAQGRLCRPRRDGVAPRRRARYFAGGRLSIADFALYGYTHVAGEGGFDLDRFPAVQAWIARVASEPGHVTIDA